MTDYFYDFKYFSGDTYDVEPAQTVLGEIYIRFSIDEIQHKRIVYDFYDYLESIGGVPDVLK